MASIDYVIFDEALVRLLRKSKVRHCLLTAFIFIFAVSGEPRSINACCEFYFDR